MQLQFLAFLSMCKSCDYNVVSAVQMSSIQHDYSRTGCDCNLSWLASASFMLHIGVVGIQIMISLTVP